MTIFGRPRRTTRQPFLDDVADTAPIPTLPDLVAEGGGRGIAVAFVLSSPATAVRRWGKEGADATTTTLVCGPSRP